MTNRISYFALGAALAVIAITMAGPTRTSRRTATVEVVKAASDAVVNISTEQVVARRSNPFFPYSSDPIFDEFFRDFFDPRYARRQVRHSLGSGVIIDSSGHVLTNEHVILSTSQVTITLHDGRTVDAELIGADTETDLAVLRLNTNDPLPYLEMGDSDTVMVGEPAIAIGNPFGLGHTVTTGVISAVKRSIQAEDRVYHDFIQTDASINPGNSGGPLLNADGELIGINSAIYQKAQGIGFAIPINRARNVVEDLIKYGKVHVGWLGIQVRDLTNTTARQLDYEGGGGVVVSLIVDGGPAQKAGLKYGDIIEEFDGVKVKTKDEFRAAVRRIPVGKKVKLRIYRGGDRETFTLVTEEFPLKMAEEVARYMLGVSVAEPGRASSGGVVVDKVAPGSPADRIGMRKGDLILKVNNDPIKNTDAWRKAIAKIRMMDSVLLLVQRGRSVYYVTMPISV